LLDQCRQLDFNFVAGQRPVQNAKGRIPTTMEWAHKVTETDMQLLRGQAPYSENMPDVDEGFCEADLKDPKRAAAIWKVVNARLEKSHREHPNGYLVREAPAEDIRALGQLAGHIQVGLFITKFRKTFTRGEMNDDLVIVPARWGGVEDQSEYEEILPTSPP
jgi:hypothetical protein